MDGAPDALIARFRASYGQLLTAAEPADHRIALAVSGGPDSMAMLGLARAAFPKRVIAATVDHGLRPAGAEEAAMVARACERLGVAHSTLTIGSTPATGDNVQAWARQRRYALLTRWAVTTGAATLCTAHHADDQAETFLMRAARASGLSGLAGIRARIPADDEGRPVSASAPHALVLLRPLLHWRRQPLRSAAEALRMPFIDDPSNRDPRFDRTRFREWLATATWLDAAQIARTADNIAAVEAELQDVSRWLWRERAMDAPDREARVDVTGLPHGVKRYLVRLGIDYILSINGMRASNWTGGANVEALLEALEMGSAATQAGVHAIARGTIWHFRMAPARRTH